MGQTYGRARDDSTPRDRLSRLNESLDFDTSDPGGQNGGCFPRPRFPRRVPASIPAG